MTTNPRMGGLEWLFLLILSTLWGGSFFFAKVAVAEVPPLTLVLCRVGIAAAALFLYLKVSGRDIPASAKIWGAFFGMGLINNVIPFSLLFWGQIHIASSLASILNATTPIFTVLVAHFLTHDEKFNFNRVVGVVLGFAGVALMLGFDPESNLSNPPLAMLACLGAAISYAFASVFGRRFAAMNVGPARVAFGQLTASTAMMLPIVLLTEPLVSPLTLSQSVLFAILALALVSTALAYILFFRILAAGGATNISLVTLLVPVSAIVLGSVFLSEQLRPMDFAGMMLIGCGLVAIDGRLFKRASGRA